MIYIYFSRGVIFALPFSLSFYFSHSPFLFYYFFISHFSVVPKLPLIHSRSLPFPHLPSSLSTISLVTPPKPSKTQSIIQAFGFMRETQRRERDPKRCHDDRDWERHSSREHHHRSLPIHNGSPVPTEPSPVLFTGRHRLSWLTCRRHRRQR